MILKGNELEKIIAKRFIQVFKCDNNIEKLEEEIFLKVFESLKVDNDGSALFIRLLDGTEIKYEKNSNN